jgi:hypothetical protein
MINKVISFVKSFFSKKNEKKKKVFVNKDGVNKVIEESKLSEYLAKGYKRGRINNKKKK